MRDEFAKDSELTSFTTQEGVSLNSADEGGEKVNCCCTSVSVCKMKMKVWVLVVNLCFILLLLVCAIAVPILLRFKLRSTLCETNIDDLNFLQAVGMSCNWYYCKNFYDNGYCQSYVTYLPPGVINPYDFILRMFLFFFFLHFL